MHLSDIGSFCSGDGDCSASNSYCRRELHDCSEGFCGCLRTYYEKENQCQKGEIVILTFILLNYV